MVGRVRLEGNWGTFPLLNELVIMMYISLIELSFIEVVLGGLVIKVSVKMERTGSMKPLNWSFISKV